MRIRSLAHTRYQHQFHIVWGTKYRRRFIIPAVKVELVRMIFDFIKTQPELHIETLNTDYDHIHMQIEMPPSILESSVVQRIKWITSIKLKKKFGFINKMYLKRQSVWSAGYFSSTIGLNEEQIKEYIQHQGRKDKPAQVKLGFS
ncbi:hypothetical protein COT86_00885 [Candidatus Collierbacteria bacterium CG10_big_fil_rev_8_21_14_0_10_43_36]|uniref:Transposase IS200-like domain-containing protein n=1 Tax=Candidatus Collierbacteria bacterium CG10_big_fil_rev_8_21_14_0_10_43_36 TaxID=1974534 RepID=A0A2H0VLP8_9BACT|nr:MAG: hypothetical protein COT86_00885 [Candidatus Collierbacteria bacterium CG10_big_fil_rev_8_21_14_0_10_43_36]